jgi:hypothetical protein
MASVAARRPYAEAMRRLIGCAALAAIGIAALSGCGAIGGGGDIPSEGPLAVHPRPEGGMDALLEGTVRIDDGCVRVDYAPAEYAVPSFPAGDATYADGILTWKGEEYRTGDPIALGGGFAGTASSPSASGYMPKACVGTEVFVVSPYQ